MDSREVFARARRGAVVYTDSPYVPLSSTAHFTHCSSYAVGSKSRMQNN
ncbi:MAG: hypothetical protein ACU4EQ_07745 [Candidatus Nitrosoglobus sp.]